MTRLKLRDDAYYAPTSEGICILTNSGEVVLTGPSIFQWVDRLVPYLDGSHTLALSNASYFEAICDIPNTSGIVLAGRCEPDAIRTERDLYHASVVAHSG